MDTDRRPNNDFKRGHEGGLGNCENTKDYRSKHSRSVGVITVEANVYTMSNIKLLIVINCCVVSGFTMKTNDVV